MYAWTDGCSGAKSSRDSGGGIVMPICYKKFKSVRAVNSYL